MPVHDPIPRTAQVEELDHVRVAADRELVPVQRDRADRLGALELEHRRRAGRVPVIDLHKAALACVGAGRARARGGAWRGGTGRAGRVWA